MKKVISTTSLLLATGIAIQAQNRLQGVTMGPGAKIYDFVDTRVTTASTSPITGLQGDGTGAGGYYHSGAVLTVDGIYNAGTSGVDIFNGTVAQTIAGNTAPAFAAVTFNNGSSGVMNITNT